MVGAGAGLGGESKVPTTLNVPGCFASLLDGLAGCTSFASPAELGESGRAVGVKILPFFSAIETGGGTATDDPSGGVLDTPQPVMPSNKMPSTISSNEVVRAGREKRFCQE